MSEFRLSRSGDVPGLRQLWKDCFGDSDAFLDLFFSLAYAPERALVVAQGKEILGAAYWFGCTMESRKPAYLYAVAIAPSHQNLGLGSALMDALHTVLRETGYDAALLVPGEEGLRRFYSKFGYRTCSFRPTEVLLPSLCPVSAEEYARLRRELLPENGVIQEGENLAFLSALADFYRGDHAIAALSKADGSCLELLGCPPIGEAAAYAMGKSLTDIPLPDSIYFAFGFD